MPTKTKRDIYQEVTDTILDALNRGVAPWHKPWRSILDDSTHRNFASKKAYRGVNIFLLDLVAASRGYDLPYWLTWKQAKDKGGKIRKGEKGTLVVFWKPVVWEDKDKLDAEGKPTKVSSIILRHYTVFNIAQTEGIEVPLPVEQEPFDANERAQEIIDNMPNAPTLSHGGDRAVYRPSTDSIRLPRHAAFETPDDYYRTAFHEEGHATGHESRLHRIKDWSEFGSEPYAKEELVAEMTSAMLAAVAGIEGVDQSAGYIDHWASKISDDKKLVIHAAAQAQKAADFILGRTEAEATNGNGEGK